VRLRSTSIAGALIAAAVLAACGSSGSGASATTTSVAATTTSAAADTTAAPTTASGATTTTEYVPPARGDADLVIWADVTRAPVLEPIAKAFGDKEGIKVVVQQVPFDKIRDNLIKSGPAGQGPDIIIGAHDWLGELVKNGVVEPLNLGASAANYEDVAVKAFTYEGKTYGLPYAVENIALIRNTDLVPTAPKTWEDVEKVALQLKKDGKVDIPLAIQEAPADPYHNFPLYSLTGANVFAQNADGTYDPKQLGLDTPAALASAANFKKWSDEGLISKDVDYNIMIDKFGTGKAPFAITGPWAVSQDKNGFKAMGVHYVVEPIPPLANGKPAHVFVGVQGFMISHFSKSIDLAKTFLLDYVNKEDVQLQLFKAGGRPPAMKSAFEQVKSDPDVAGFGLAGQAGQPQPAIPAMSAVWDNWKDAYSLIFTGNDPTKAFKDAASTIRAKIG
jgi:arabinogalactan oligomer/maltooligosaccharide transport system substrate-binding protein